MSYNNYGSGKKPVDLPAPKYLPSRKSAVTNPGFSFVNQQQQQLDSRLAHLGHSSATKRRYKIDHDDDADLDDDNVKFQGDFDYDNDGDDDDDDLPYAPAPGSPAATKKKDNSEDSEEDPLDAFMAGLKGDMKESENKSSTVDIKAKKKGSKATDIKKGVRDDIEEEDMQESYFRYLEEHPNAGMASIDDENVILEYDAEGNAIIPDSFKMIDPLPPCDHSKINYEPFEKMFYREHEDIASATQEQVAQLRRALDVKCSGFNPPKPVTSFGHFGFDETLIELVRNAGFEKPTPIQSQGIPAVLSGRDVIGIAKTGSGKTCAYLWPMLVHIMDQPELGPNDGPIALICAPTRELAMQIYNESKHFGKAYGVRSVCCYGGGNMYEQEKACKEGAEILVCTPGRLIDLVKKKATNLERVTFVVFDEADRMFDMGFEAQVRSIANHTRPDRQTLMFSATFKKRVERVARAVLDDPVRIIHGDLGEANADITQIPLVFREASNKWFWLLENLIQFCVDGQVLIFVTRKSNSEELATNLKAKDFKVGLIHGDMHQSERNDIITRFKKGEIPILVATDVAARGLDIPAIKTVVNYDPARDIDTHIHRIGRTGRAGTQGKAYTLLLADPSEKYRDKDFASHFVKHLEASSLPVPDDVMELAMKCQWFSKQREKQERQSGTGMFGLSNDGSWIGVGTGPSLDSQTNLSGGGSGVSSRGRGRGLYQSGPKKVRVGLSTAGEMPSQGFAQSNNYRPDYPPGYPVFQPQQQESMPGSASAHHHHHHQQQQQQQQQQQDEKPMDRLSAMRNAFASHFKSSFVASSDSGSASKITSEQLQNEIAKKKKKSRWD